MTTSDESPAPKPRVAYQVTADERIVEVPADDLSPWDFAEADAITELIDKYARRAHRASRAQYLTGNRASILNNLVGVPVVVLTASAGTAVFATLSGSPAVVWRVATGTVSIAAAVLAALQTFFGFGAKSAKHRAYGARYYAAYRDLDLLKIDIAEEKTTAEVAAELRTVAQRLSKLDDESPDVPDRFYDRARREEEADEEGI